MWLYGLASAFGIKLSSSIDDVVWLAPFLTGNSSVAMRMWNSAIYMGVCLTQTVIAMLIAASGSEVVSILTAGNKDAWSTEKILTVGAGCLLSLYSVKLTYEWIQECNEPEEEEPPEDAEKGEEAGTGYEQVPTTEAEADEAEAYNSDRGGKWYCCRADPGGSKEGVVEMAERQDSKEAKDAKEEPEEAPAGEEAGGEDKDSKSEKDTSSTLFVIAFIGSVDDLTLFVPMLVGKGFDTMQLMLGAFLATSLIISFCICIGLCKPIADCLSKIPLAVIVICFATVLLLKAFVFDQDEHHHRIPTNGNPNVTNVTAMSGQMQISINQAY